MTYISQLLFRREFFCEEDISAPKRKKEDFDPSTKVI